MEKIKPRKNGPLIIFTGFFLLLCFLFDDLSTGLLYAVGLGNLETNRFAHLFGYFGFLLMNLTFYFLLLFSMKFMMSHYERLTENKGLFFKMYDVFIFLGCLIIVYITYSKVSYGIENYTLLANYHTDPVVAEQIDTVVAQNEVLLETTPSEYYESQHEYYDTATGSMTYFEFIFLSLGAYLLMRLDFRVSLWGK